MTVDIEKLKAKAEEAKSVKQCYGALHGCPHCYFEVSPDEALELIARIEGLEEDLKDYRRIQAREFDEYLG